MFTVWNYAGLPQVYAGPSPVAAASAVGRVAPIGDGGRSAQPTRPDPYTRAQQRLGEQREQRHRVVAARELMSSPVEVLRATTTVAEAWAVPYWLTDTAMVVQNLLLLVEERGLGALFFGLTTDPAGLMARFGVPAGMHPLGAVAIGVRARHDRPSGTGSASSRKPAAQVIHVGSW